MRYRTYILLFSLCLLAVAVPGSAQPDSTGRRTSVAASPDFGAYRPLGEFRLWTLIVRDSVVGKYTSTVTGTTVVDGLSGYVIKEELNVDMSRAARPGNAVRYRLSSERQVAADGTYFGDVMDFTVNDDTARIELRREGPSLEGSVRQGGRETPQSIAFDPPVFAVDNLLFDQLELFLAMQDIVVGDTLRATLFVPRDLATAPLTASVESFQYYQLYRGVFDSVFVIKFLQPQAMVAYFSPLKRLLKIHVVASQVKAYLDIVRKEPPPPPRTSASETATRMVSLVPGYIVYALLGLLSAALFVGDQYRRKLTYLALLVGAGGFLLTTITLLPLQFWLLRTVLIPGAARGGSPYWLGLLPALAAGIIEELLKLALLVGTAAVAKLAAERVRGVGTALGAGFGILWACHLATISNSDPFSWALLERGFTILFHAVSGAWLGRALYLRSAQHRWWPVVILLVATNALLHYLPVFVQQGVISAVVLHLLVPTLVLALALAALMSFRKG